MELLIRSDEFAMNTAGASDIEDVDKDAAEGMSPTV